MTSDTSLSGTNEASSTVQVLISSLVVATCFVVALIGCICCYKFLKKDEEEYESLKGEKTISEDSLSYVTETEQSLQNGQGKQKLQRPGSRYSLQFQSQNVQPKHQSSPKWMKNKGAYSRENSGSSASSTNNAFEEDEDNQKWPLKGVSKWVSGAVSMATNQSEVNEDSIDAPSDGAESPSPSGEKLGRIQFDVRYNFQELELKLKVIRAVNLPAKDFSGTSDPYVKLMLLPDKNTKMKTNIKRKNLNPRWNETFAFQGYPFNKLMARTLHLQVYDYDRFSRDDPIGEVCVPLNVLNLEEGQTLWRDLQPCKGQTGRRGELLVSLCYNPSSNQLKVDIIKARELKAKDINGYSDPYVKIWLMKDGKKAEKRKTKVKTRNLNPVYNETFIFEVAYESLRATSLMLSVKDQDRMGRNETIGELLLGSKSGPLEVKHWGEMFAKSRQPVAQWHVLKKF